MSDGASVADVGARRTRAARAAASILVLCASWWWVTALPAAAGVPEWVERASPAAGLERFPSDDVVQLALTRSVTVEKSGERVVVERSVYHVRRGDGGPAQTCLFAQSDTRRFGGMRGWRVEPDGTDRKFDDVVRAQIFDGVLYSESVTCAVHIPAVPGCVIAHEVEYRETRREISSDVMKAHRGASLLAAAYELKRPPGWTASAMWLRGDSSSAAPPDEDDGRIARWSWGPVRLVRIEERPSCFELPPAAFIGVRCEDPRASGLSTWTEVSGWFQALASSALEDGERLRPVLDELSEDGPSRRDLAARIAGHVRSTCRYVPVHLGDGAWRPRAATTVHETRFGDCKDMAFEAIALLRLAGIDAYGVLTTAGGSGAHPEFPTPYSFDHCIAAIALDGPDEPPVYFDATAEHVPFGRLPAPLEGAWALVVGAPAETALVRLPAGTADENRTSTRVRLELLPDLSASALVEQTLTGHPAFEMQAYLEAQNAEERRQSLQRLIETRIPGAKVLEAEIPETGSPDDSLTMRYRLAVPAVGRSAGSMALVRTDLLAPRNGALFSEPERRFDIVFPYPYVAESVTEIAIPSGCRLDSAPAAVSVRNPFGDFDWSIEPRPDGVRAVREERVHAASTPASRYAEARAWDAAADAADHERLSLRCGE